MVRVSENDQGVHPFTAEWWRQLPQALRLADRAQGEVLAPAWDGLNRDPRFVTGFDGWERVNTSGKNPYVASVSFTRTFTPTPNVPVLIRSWHTPLITGTTTLTRVRVTHTVRNYTGTIVASTQEMVGSEQGSVDTWVTPDRFGRITVTVDVAIETAGAGGFNPDATGQGGKYTAPGVTMTSPGVYTGDAQTGVKIVSSGRYQVQTHRTGTTAQATMDTLAAIHVGPREVVFEELPDLAAFTTQKPYPLLRYMDGIGHLAGFLDDELGHLWDGDTTDPVTAPDEWLRFLGTMLGLPKRYMGRLTMPQLRSHLVAFAEQGRPPIGSSRNIAEVAKQWLTGDKQISVLPAGQVPIWMSPQEKSLLSEVNGSSGQGRAIVSEPAPVPDFEYTWMGEPHASSSQMNVAGSGTAENRVINPQFVLGKQGWATGDTAPTVIDTSVYETGACSLKLVPQKYDWFLLGSELIMPSTDMLNVRFRVYTDSAQSIRVILRDGSGNTRYGETVRLEPRTWTTVEGSFYTPIYTRCSPGIASTGARVPLRSVWVDRAYMARRSWSSESYFDGDTPDSSVNDIWVQPGSPNKVYKWDNKARWVAATATQSKIDAVVTYSVRASRVFTLVMLVRSDELPNRNLAAFQKFMQNSGVIPAGHKLVCLEARPSWEQWETAVGPTWNDLESRTRTWTDMEAAGVALDY